MVVVIVNVLKFIFVIGGLFGVGNYGMCGCVYFLCFMWIWFNLCILVMGGE